MLRDGLIAVIRTGVAALVGAVVTYLVSVGFEFPEGFEAQLITAVFTLATAAYNALVLWLQKHVHPAFGWLLGVAKAPVYEPKV